MDEQAKRHFRRAASMIDQLLRSDGYDILVVGGHEYELGEFFRLLPHELRGRVAGTFSADPIATPVAEIRSSAEGVMQEALIDQLEARREELLRRLGQPHRTNGS